MKKQTTSFALEVANLTVAYEGNPVLKNTSCSIPTGVMLAIVGPNGAGKSTFIKTVLGLIKPISGSISVLSQSIKNALPHISYVPQRSSIDWDFPATVYDVVMMGRYGKIGWFFSPKKDDHKKVMDALQTVGLIDFKDRPIGKLSGGQQQRCFLARALVSDPQMYLLDEPFVGVDLSTEKAIVSVLQSLQKQGKTIIVVHHDLQTLQEYFNWIMLLNVSTVACGPIDRVLVPEFVCKAYGQGDIYSYTVSSSHSREGGDPGSF